MRPSNQSDNSKYLELNANHLERFLAAAERITELDRVRVTEFLRTGFGDLQHRGGTTPVTVALPFPAEAWGHS